MKAKASKSERGVISPREYDLPATPRPPYFVALAESRLVLEAAREGVAPGDECPCGSARVFWRCCGEGRAVLALVGTPVKAGFADLQTAVAFATSLVFADGGIAVVVDEANVWVAELFADVVREAVRLRDRAWQFEWTAGLLEHLGLATSSPPPVTPEDVPGALEQLARLVPRLDPRYDIEHDIEHVARHFSVARTKKPDDDDDDDDDEDDEDDDEDVDLPIPERGGLS